MNRFQRASAAALVAGSLALSGAPARAQDESQPLIVGAVRLFMIRKGDTLNGREMSVHDRIGHIQDVYAKYLGGQSGKITSKRWGDRTHLYLNGEFVLAVTPADAEATGYRSADQLAPVWMNGLRRGFEEARVNSFRPS